MIEIPKSSFSEGKTIVEETAITRFNKAFLKRLYDDGSSELIRYDDKQNKYIFLCFPATEREDKMSEVMEAVKNNFDF